MVELVDEADADAADAGARLSSSFEQFCPAISTSPAVGASSRPAMCSSDDLPEPDWPTSATISPAWTVEVQVLEHVEPALAFG